MFQNTFRYTTTYILILIHTRTHTKDHTTKWWKWWWQCYKASPINFGSHSVSVYVCLWENERVGVVVRVDGYLKTSFIDAIVLNAENTYTHTQIGEHDGKQPWKLCNCGMENPRVARTSCNLCNEWHTFEASRTWFVASAIVSTTSIPSDSSTE